MRDRRLVLSFGVMTALVAAGYGVMFTLLDDFHDEYGIPKASLGLIVSSGFFSAFFAQVLFAPMADRGRARRLVNIGVVVNIAGLLLMAFGKTTEVLLVGRVLMGVGQGMVSPAIRRIIILADRDNLGSNMGRILAADVAGFAFGPAVSAVLVGPFGIAAPFLFIAGASLATFPLLASVHVAETAAADMPDARFAFDLLRSKPYAAALLIGSASFVMVGTFDALWVLVLDDLRTADWIANVGIIMFAVPLVVLGSRGGRLAQRIGPFRLGTYGALLGAAFMFGYGQWPSGGLMFAAAMVHALSDGMTITSSGVAVGMVVPPERMAGAQGLLGAAQTLMGGVAAGGAGLLYEHQGRGLAYGMCAAAMVAFTITGVLLVGRQFSVRPSADDPVPTPDIATEHLPFS